MVIVGCGSTSPRSSLEQAAEVDYPKRFVFVDRPGAANLMECLGVAETLVVTVDADQKLMAVRLDGESNPVIIWSGDASYVDASLLTTQDGWIRIERDLAGSARADVEAALGAPLSGYMFADGITPDPISVARSVLAVAGDISESEASSGEVTVSVEVDVSLGAVDGLDVESIPDLRFRIVGDQIVAIGARLTSDDEESFVFVWEYDQTAVVPAVAAPLEFTELSDVAGGIGTGGRRPAECALEF